MDRRVSDAGSAMVAAARRFLARLLPAGRREWVRAAWAESHELPPGPRRRAWQAGTVLLAARQLITARSNARRRVALFTLAAGVVAWLSWPGSAANFTTLVDRVDAIAVAALLAAVALFARWRFGPVRDGWLARALRISGYAAILAIMPAKAVVEQFTYAVPAGGERLRLYGFVKTGADPVAANWAGEVMFLVIMTGYAVTVLWVTSKRARIARTTLAIAAIDGMVVGGVMYLVAPLGGLGKRPTSPWFGESGMALLIAGAAVMLFAGPALAGLLAARRYQAPSGSANSANSADAAVVKQRQGLVAGTLANLVAALIVTLAGTGTIALMIKSATARDWLLHGQHLTANALYVRELNAGSDAVVYFLMCLTFPVLGLFSSVLGAGFTGSHRGASRPDDGGTPEPVTAPL